MDFTTEKAFAKINISLDVTGKRPDGYHDMLMVMQSVTLCDDVRVELTANRSSTAVCNLPFVPSDGRNLAVRAADSFFAAAGITGVGARIGLYKRIPVGAGMAGGSSDAAAVLRALNRLCGRPFDESGLRELACGIGSDVPFCVTGGTMLASGRGELLSPLPELPDCSLVICKPEFSVSTPELFRKLDSVRLRCHPDTQGIIEALEAGDLVRLSRRMYNVFEDVPDRRHSTISHIKSVMLDFGALGSVMTGTGSAVFGIFDSEAAAENACRELGREFALCCTARNQPGLEL
ncbi:MAG: 4-(cytidine 5'-diphospho)-2-C-methyl-D-erythritol kinase [Oscillospiraceae bacterium]|nr:4-(cytidine 5'-diphospho)-2-C-methyl-D-erythritol kinase [Oscillospiraceae bacterium]